MNHQPATTATATGAAVDRIATALAIPTPPPAADRWHSQSLSGAAGTALLHIERAHTGSGSWATAHRWLALAAGPGITTSTRSGLYTGTLAVAFALHTAAVDGTGRYRQAIATADAALTALTHARLDVAEARIAAGARPTLAEYDLIGGLTGLGAHLLAYHPGGDALGRVLAHLVRLTQRVRCHGHALPGWWSDQSPQIGLPLPGGHANAGLAHGITGPLALLGLAQRAGVTVDGQREAIVRIVDWLERWRQPGHTGTWWPQWITIGELQAG